jgi:serine protease Do
MRALQPAIVAAALLAVLVRPAAGQPESAGGPFASAIDSTCQRVVKLYGGGYERARGFGSGVLVSADGMIATTLGVLLESPALRAVLPDGRRYPARVVKRDETRQLALLQIDAADLPHFELGSSTHLRAGDWVLAAANPFKVAEGPEPVSVAVGAFSGRATLSARRRKQDFPYEGPVLLTDVIVATPGSAGGALADVQGRLVGLIGKAVISTQTNTWLNYALPVEEVATLLRDRPDPRPEQTPSERQAAADQPEPDLGLQLFDVGGRTRPAYVERVRPDSPARRAGIRPNDLILSLAGEPTDTCAEFYDLRARLRAGEQIEVVVKRGDELQTLRVTVGGRER